MVSQSEQAYRAAYQRSHGHCEVMVKVQGSREVWTRCGSRQVEVHHKITRARGGTHLDNVGEHRHLMVLCRKHHAMAHDQAAAYGRGLLISGYVTLENDRPVYYGPDLTLKRSYGLGRAGLGRTSGGSSVAAQADQRSAGSLGGADREGVA